MSTEGVLGNKKLRRIKNLTGIDAARGWAWHPFWEFRDAEDRHYWLCTRTHKWQEVTNPRHYTSCPKSGIRPSITCPRCGRTSPHPQDICEKYCGNYHQFHETMTETT